MSDIPPSPGPTVASNMSSGDQQDPPIPLSRASSRASGARTSRRGRKVKGKLRNASTSRTNKKSDPKARHTAAEKGKQRADPPGQREDHQLRATAMNPLDKVIEDHLNRQRPGTPIVGSTTEPNAKPKTPTNLITAVFRYLSSQSEDPSPTHDQLPQVSERPLLEDFFETDKWAREFLKTKFELERFDYDDRVVTLLVMLMNDIYESHAHFLKSLINRARERQAERKSRMLEIMDFRISYAVMTQYKPPKPEFDVTPTEASDAKTFSDTKDIRPGDTCNACGQVQPVVTSLNADHEKISPADQARGTGSHLPTQSDLPATSPLLQRGKKSTQNAAPSASSATVQHKKKGGRPRKIKTSEERAGTTATVTTSADRRQKSPPVVGDPTPAPAGPTSTMSTRRHRYVPSYPPDPVSVATSPQQGKAATSHLQLQPQLLPNSEYEVPFSHRRNPPRAASTTTGHQQCTTPQPPPPRRSKRQTNKGNQRG